MNKQQLQQEIADLQKQLEEKQKALSAMPDEWNPKRGNWFVYGGAACKAIHVHDDLVSFGIVYDSKEQTEKAAKAMRAHNRLLAYVAEFAPDYEFVKGGLNWCVRIDLDDGRWVANWQRSLRHVGNVYMPKNIAVELVKKLNSGEVQL